MLMTIVCWQSQPLQSEVFLPWWNFVSIGRNESVGSFGRRNILVISLGDGKPGPTLCVLPLPWLYCVRACWGRYRSLRNSLAARLSPTRCFVYFGLFEASIFARYPPSSAPIDEESGASDRHLDQTARPDAQLSSDNCAINFPIASEHDNGMVGDYTFLVVHQLHAGNREFKSANAEVKRASMGCRLTDFRVSSSVTS